jgi:TolB protein
MTIRNPGRWFWLLTVFGMLALLGADIRDAQARTYIDITKPISRKLPLALPNFQPMAGAVPSSLGPEGSRLLGGNLMYTGLFELLNPSTFLGPPEMGAVNYRRWSRVGAELLITGQYRLNGDMLTLECRLFDVLDGKQLVGRQYEGRPGDLKVMMNRFADAVMEALTGQKSVFGTMIAFVAARQGDKGVIKEIALMQFDGSGVRMLTHRKDLALYPSWSPDGSLLAYSAFRNRRPVVFLHALNGGSGRPIIDLPGVNITPVFDPANGNLAAALSHTGKTNIFLGDRTGKLIKQLTDGWGIDVAPSFSPDGRELAFTSDRAGSPQIYVLDTSNGQSRRICFGYKYAASPDWSPRGDRIAFQLEVNGVFQIATIRPDGTDLQVLTRGMTAHEDPSWSPDGRLLAYAGRRTGRYQIYVMTAGGEPIKRLTNLPGENTDPAWSPSGVIR